MLSGLQGAASGAHLYPLAEHWRQILNRRTPEERRTLSHVKRFMERLAGDGKFRTALAENLDAPRALTERYGIEVDPLEMLPLWCGDYLKFRFKPESASWPLAMLWDEYMREISHHRDLLRDQGEMSMIDHRFHAWRERQIRRCNDELGELAPSITHPIIAFELSEGCTVGCWFCGLSADRFKGYFEYSEEHAELWRGVVGVASEMFGSAARTGFCYWATDPIDNPDYDRFLLDYHQITGALPQTTTAAPLKDEALTRRVLELFKRFGGVTNRFSVLSTKHLNQIHAAFSPEDLIGVELILQGKAAPTAKAFVGRARARKEKFKVASKDDATALPEGYPTTIACVSGFLVNMRQGRLQLVTPVPGSERWPLGYRIVGQRFFRTPDEFREGLQSIIDEHMLESPPPNLPIRFRGGLQYEAGYRYFHLRSRNIEFRVLDDVVPISVGDLIACGNCTASELIMRVTTDGASALAVADMLDQLYAAGVIEEDLDEVSLGTTSTV
ncbi:radical SAM family RiPP maturation amino acid epimerase [Mesorhizobium sp.]|uniref:radical SAM family RiPP maturation amino acid epimerase n=1 Tax=Mesorhizobium sp. TaxID=1871066 RepID=UPI000FE4320A|nr:radical SAM family RiPP maturation amino acid epimerase [Mesorhizobium sp.]RWM44848.1 MAG: radical SAM family RiPP maturation amino acid epimerase [Mesorhizobium sp.]RWM68581.1 MAG: radical SAM family RiPP maturation amino acid epimerase [Mesorhizobium sp.]RWM90544.1 MAG: radical SAM family RiPP maturation amino acid epimerase [Mesorhizobium sp.]RWN52378.1 MAG: radical SAM family RiPP maturation amino acid epimerase [Mesorhizobium sp.]RWN93344.1 MAG: radical SAM family RiPP maturation amino